jgi:soluble lytic murein transglycosylase-like protein
MRLDRILDARVEFTGLIDETWKDDALALYALALYFQQVDLYSLSVTCADRIALLASNAGAPDPPRYLNLLRYPTYYSDLVIAESRANGQSPLEYFAIIRLESRFDTWVTGPLKEKDWGN